MNKKYMCLLLFVFGVRVKTANDDDSFNKKRLILTITGSFRQNDPFLITGSRAPTRDTRFLNFAPIDVETHTVESEICNNEGYKKTVYKIEGDNLITFCKGTITVTYWKNEGRYKLTKRTARNVAMPIYPDGISAQFVFNRLQNLYEQQKNSE